jgi:hypothetical protein
MSDESTHNWPGTYARVLLIEALVIYSLWLFSSFFSY